MKHLVFTLLCLATACGVQAQGLYQALKFKEATSYFSYEMLSVHQQNLTRKQNLEESLRSPQALQAYIAGLRTRFSSLVGPLPARTPIRAKQTGSAKGNGFEVQKIVFQSAPGRYVTCHLFLPENRKGKLPACIEMCGHGLNGKGNGSELAERMAVNGIATLVVDPIEQGERLQLIDSAGHTLCRGVTTAHTLLAPAYMLVGSSMAAQEYFDNSRAIDYLMSRNDIDTARIGAYGFSGGGTQACYLAALDNRLKATCCALFFSSRERTLEAWGPSDGCQWMPYEGRERIEIADMALMAAPKPFLVLDGVFDFVDHWGALRGFDELHRAYQVMGVPERVEQYYVNDGHAAPLASQEKMVRFFRRWLANDSNGVLKPLTTWKGSNMLCTKSGQVNTEYADAVSSMADCEQAMDKLADKRKAFCAQPIETIRQQIKELLNISNTSSDIETMNTGNKQLRDEREERYQITRSNEYPIPVIVRIPDNCKADAPVIIHLSDRGKAFWLSEQDRQDNTSDGSIHVAADLRGLGESADLFDKNYSKYWNDEYRCAVVALHTGRPLLGQRITDILTLIDFCCHNKTLQGHPIRLVADGESALAAMHATLLDPQIEQATLYNVLRSWRSYISNPIQHNMMPNVVPGVLAYYDIPDLLKLAKDRIRIAD